ncbi:MAG: MFS transporter [Acidobacteriota bacterium]
MIQHQSRKVISWALYDWANSTYATTVMAGFFPVFFKDYWSSDALATTSTFRLGAANSIASLVIVLVAPVLGAIADGSGSRKRFLFFFTAMGVVMTGAMSLVARGEWQMAAFLYVFGTIGFSGGNIFYDSLIVGVAREGQVDLVSALGYALGYLGGGLLFLLNVWMTLRPATFGLASPAEAVQLSFLMVCLWWAAFSIPVFLFVEEPKRTRECRGFKAVKAGFQQLGRTLAEIRKLRMVFLFLIGYWLYIDGVDTIVRMAVDYGLSLGFESESLIVALLLTQFVGFPAAIAFGKIGEKWGPKRGIFICIAVYIGVTVWAVFLDQVSEFYGIAMAVGLVQGGIQALSRSYYTRLIPANKTAEFFGFYNMLGKFAAVIGPIMMGWVGVITGSSRLSILSIILLFVFGGVFLYRVDEVEGRRAAQALERD